MPPGPAQTGDPVRGSATRGATGGLPARGRQEEPDRRNKGVRDRGLAGLDCDLRPGQARADRVISRPRNAPLSLPPSS